MIRRSWAVSPGAMNAQSWYRITGIARMIPTTTAIFMLMKNASPGPRTMTFWVGSGLTRNCDDLRAPARNPTTDPTATARITRKIRLRSSPRWSSEAHHRLALGRARAGVGLGRGRGSGRERTGAAAGIVVSAAVCATPPSGASASGVESSAMTIAWSGSGDPG